MPVVGTSPKGQVIIPAALRKKIGLKAGAKVLVTLGEQDTVILRAVPADPVEAACGFLKGGPSLTRALGRERREDRIREAAKHARLVRPDRVSRRGARGRKRSDPAA
jgi:AbrB family looped-hinge helix DNA binding protein